MEGGIVWHNAEGYRDIGAGQGPGARDAGVMAHNEPVGIDAAPDGYRERLTVPWWWWLPAAAVAVILGLELKLGMDLLPLSAGIPAAAVVTVLALLGLGNSRVRIVDAELWAGDARLPLRFAEDIRPLDRADKRYVLGPDGDPAAFVLHRAWIPGAVYLRINDPDDPTPYWLVSTRHPQRLAEAMRAAQAGSALR